MRSSACSNVLGAASRFDVQNTSPEQQHEFCALWNQIVLKAQSGDDRSIACITVDILRPIRKIYVTLHQDTDAAPTAFSASTGDLDVVLWFPTSYPLCNIPGHHSDPTPHIHNDSATATFARTGPNDDAALPPSFLTSPDAPTSSVPAPHHVLNNLTGVPLPDTFHPVHQAIIESLHIPVPSPDPAAAGAIPDTVISMPDPAPEPSTPAPSLSFTSLPAAVSLQHDADLRTPFDAPNLSSLAPVLDDIIRTESHHSIIVTTSPNARPGPTSAPDLVASTEDDGSPQPGFRKETDVLDLPSVNRAIDASTTLSRVLYFRNQTLSVQEIVPWILRVTGMISFDPSFNLLDC
ncbi:hypothetical protein EDB83DRAFT_2680992 [Lactarius deliciosus]|nr:hypothetical protein EDB83DRAFT_2680992 [Lactarius deliciosus]